MPSVMGLLEERERAARQRVEALQAELREAEAVWERFVIARETVGEVLAEPRGGEDVLPVVVAGERPGRVTAAVPGSVVPHWQEGLDPTVLAPDYQRIMDVLALGGLRPAVRHRPPASLAGRVPARRAGPGRARAAEGHRLVLTSARLMRPVAVLGRRFGHPVAVANDADMGARGEHAFGAARSLDDFLYIKASHGIGAGMVLAGRTYPGSTGISGEIGHTRLQDSTSLCRCGNRGCLETVVSITEVRRQLAHVLTVSGTATDPDTLPPLDELAAARVITDAGRTIGLVLADLVNCLNPAAIVLGGELSAAGDPLATGVREFIDRYAQLASAHAVTVMAGKLQQRAELLGAVATVMRQSTTAG